MHPSFAAAFTLHGPHAPPEHVVIPAAHAPSSPSFDPQVPVSPVAHEQPSFTTPLQLASSPGAQESFAAAVTLHADHTPFTHETMPLPQLPFAPDAIAQVAVWPAVHCVDAPTHPVGWQRGVSLGHACGIAPSPLLEHTFCVIASMQPICFPGTHVAHCPFAASHCPIPQMSTGVYVPVLGLQSIEVMRETHTTAASFDAGRTLLLDRAELVAEANEAGITLVGVAPVGD